MRASLCLGATLLVTSFAVASGPAPHPSTAIAEIHFMTGMIDHHAMAIEMGEMCMEKATHAELAMMCEGIVTGQTAEVEAMTGWLAAWYGMTYEEQLTRGEERMMEKMDEMEGEEFEVEFLEEMVMHHSSAVRDSTHCLRDAAHAELLTLCSDIGVAQAAEITQMNAWLCDWYGLCRPSM